ncbi:hypothetical protein LCGC14_2762790, partial [marine sediment metagenome]
AWRAVWDGQYLLSMLDYKLFYDYFADPDEVNNLYNDPASEEKRKELESVLKGLARDTGDPILPRLEE